MEKKIEKTKHWLFDFDGTLVNSMGYWAKAMISVLDDHNIEYGDDIISIITPLGSKGTIEYFMKIGLDLPPEEIALEIAGKLTPYYRDVIVEKDGVRECIKHMHECGYGLHILTASPHIWLDPCLERIGIAKYFDNVWSSDDFGRGKTDPQIYIDAAGRIGVHVSDITFLDDNVNADKAAKRSGVRVVGVFDTSTASDEAEMREVTDGYIYNFGELEKAVCD